MARLIDADKRIAEIKKIYCDGCDNYGGVRCRACWVDDAICLIDDAPTVDAVPVEKYNELREAFVDYVCSGVNNQAPYCKNRIDGDCVDERGWCTYRHCRGFNPDGERKDGDGNG